MLRGERACWRRSPVRAFSLDRGRLLGLRGCAVAEVVQRCTTLALLLAQLVVLLQLIVRHHLLELVYRISFVQEPWHDHRRRTANATPRRGQRRSSPLLYEEPQQPDTWAGVNSPGALPVSDIAIAGDNTRPTTSIGLL